jgi:hypothetical protein
MIQLLPQEEVLTPNSTVPSEAIDIINSYVKNYHCENLTVDISAMNVIDACHVTMLCGANHLIKYPNGKIFWIVSSELVKSLGKHFELGNAEYVY